MQGAETLLVSTAPMLQPVFVGINNGFLLARFTKRWSAVLRYALLITGVDKNNRDKA
jgi:hypothetical protein